jgi:hypothetical protein
VDAQHLSITNDHVPLMFYLFLEVRKREHWYWRLLMLSLIRAGIANVLSLYTKITQIHSINSKESSIVTVHALNMLYLNVPMLI